MIDSGFIFLVNRMNITAWKTQLGSVIASIASGLLPISYAEQTGSYAIVDEDYMVCSTGAGTSNFTLPLAATAGAGKRYELVMSGSGQLTVTPSGSDTIAGVSGADATMLQYERRVYTSDGVSNWIS